MNEPKPIIPVEVLKPLLDYCKEHNLGVLSAGSNDIFVLMAGNNEMHPNHLGTAAAHITLEAVLSGAFIPRDEQQQSEVLESKPH